MNTDKKNQHYIPKFFLRNFSFDNNLKQIGVFNTRTNFFFQTAPLRSQGSKSFFYGHDGIIEDNLSNIEGHLSKSINQIISNQKIPKKDDFEYLQLLHFVALTHLRNPILIESIIAARELMKNEILAVDMNAKVDKLIPKISRDMAIEVALSGIKDVVENILDLDCKLLINKTNRQFIGSDFLVVKYNRFLELINWQRGKTG